MSESIVNNPTDAISPSKAVERQVVARLQSAFAPTYLEVLNESHQHNVPADAETHFKVTLVTDQFTDLRPIKRHQAVYGALQALLAGPIHALALHTYTPAEWNAQGVSPDSPHCMGGSKHDR